MPQVPQPPMPIWRDEEAEAKAAAKARQEADERARFLNSLERIADAMEKFVDFEEVKFKTRL